MHRTISISFYLIVFFVSSFAFAYQTIKSNSGKDAYWPAGRQEIPVPYYINDKGCKDISDGSDFKAIQDSFQTWEDVNCSTITFDYKGKNASVYAGINNGTNLMIWPDSWPGQFGNNAIGVTTPITGASGQIYDADIQFNQNYFCWSTTSNWNNCGWGRSPVDVANIATHEIGHFLGLAHSKYSDATMYYSSANRETNRRSLSPDDIKGICYIYPVQAGQGGGFGSPCSADSDCTDGVCTTNGSGKFCSKKCSTATDCPSGYQCTNSVCASGDGGGTTTGEAGVGEACGHTSSGMMNCKSGLLCLADSSGSQQGKCFETCQPDNNNPQSSCPSGKICQPVGNPKTNAPTGGACIDQSNIPSGTNDEGAACGQAEGDCKQGLLCIVTSQGDQSGTCRQQCDPQNSQCKSGYSCAGLQGGGGVCMPAGAAGGAGSNEEGAVCSQSAGTCKEGLICIVTSEGDQSGICRKKCDPQNPQCSSDYTCAELQGGAGGVCIPTAGSAIGSGGGASGGGSSGEGQMCDQKTGCSSGLVCLADSAGAQSGKCRKECNPQSPTACSQEQACIPTDTSGTKGVCMPGVGEGQTCDNKSSFCSGSMICLSAQQGEAGKCFRTCKTDTDCGQGYTCFNTGSVSVCKAVAGGGSTGGEGADGSGIGKQCKDGRDCGDLICMGGTSKICTKTCNLNSSEDCPENHVCLKTSTSSNGFCWPKDKSGAPKPFGSSCSDSSGCLSGYCVGGYCSDTCATDSECPIGFKKCSDSGDGTKVCTIFGEGKKAFGSTCSTDGDCQSAYCTEGLCVEICDANINCPSGYTCDSTAKTCMAQLSWSSTKDNGCSCTLMDLNRTSSGSNFNIVFFLILIATSLWGFRMRIHLG